MESIAMTIDKAIEIIEACDPDTIKYEKAINMIRHSASQLYKLRRSIHSDLDNAAKLQDVKNIIQEMENGGMFIARGSHFFEHDGHTYEMVYSHEGQDRLFVDQVLGAADTGAAPDAIPEDVVENERVHVLWLVNSGHVHPTA